MFPCEDSETVSVRPSVCPSVRTPRKERLSICPYPEKRNYPGFVNISPTLVIDTSMERPSRVGTTPWKPKNYVHLFEIRILTCDEKLKLPWLRQYQSYISN